jgi:hypothetical protein
MGSYLSRRVAGALVTIYVTIYKNTVYTPTMVKRIQALLSGKVLAVAISPCHAIERKILDAKSVF